jgi:hypothetical protein
MWIPLESLISFVKAPELAYQSLPVLGSSQNVLVRSSSIFHALIAFFLQQRWLTVLRVCTGLDFGYWLARLIIKKELKFSDSFVNLRENWIF